MKNHGKTIKIFLIDGDPNGRMSCELSNWTGKAYKIPRIKIKESSDRPDLENAGVYMLFGKDEEGESQVYMGEAENVLKRLESHVAEKDFWNEAIAFISKDDNLNKAHVKYMESRLYEMAKKAARYNLANTNIPTRSNISESDQSEMEEFLDNIRMLVNTLGHRFLDEKREGVSEKKQTTFQIYAARGADAKGTPVTDGFLVFKNSKAAYEVVESMPSGFNKLRDTLIEEKVLVSRGEGLVFDEDYIFSSPSTAAAIVMGRNANGLIEWKLGNRMTLRDYEASAG
ncbi:MAG: GIY-YIG nuclease family protein [Spirochaetales bacterium]|nr:GIY-YIG nuclease family protein [Spirochaetales bacterium]